MNRCPITYEPCGDNRYSKTGLRLISPGLASLRDLEYTADEQRQEAFNRASRMSVQGVQPKLSARLNIKEGRFEIVDTGGRYILKPQHDYFPEMPQNEDLTMRLADVIGLGIPLHGLIWSKDNSLTYFIRRFDRKGQNTKIPVEDFAQLAGMTRDTKYDYSLEKVVGLVNKFCTFPAVEKVELFKLIIFGYLTGNDDMHLKNFSVITEDRITRLSPCYDLINTSIEYNTPDEETALPVRGRRKKLTRNILVDYFGMERCELLVKSIDKVLERVASAKPAWQELIAASFLSKGMQEKYYEVLKARCDVLNL
jgi:serine/threonine-protein kinase HipA